MAEIIISEDILGNINDKVVFITGGASGIGKATAELCLRKGAIVVIGDLNALPADLQVSEKLKFDQVEVCSWESLQDAFIQIEACFGHIDHVFANAGVSPTTNLLDDTLDENGLLAPPNLRTVNVNLLGVISTVRLASYYIQKHSTHRSTGELGRIVVTASTASFQNFTAGDYTITKHGVLGLVRGLQSQLEGKVRLNAVSPSWKNTGMVPKDFIESLGVRVQEPEVVARSVALLFGDQKRYSEVIYSWDGKFLEANKADGGLLQGADKILVNAANEDRVMVKRREAVALGLIKI
ncbi:hypothetical protein N7471_003528 [Penicillium samsonianum]|uniref:uncharacterized protein n=1 Tax=Penicillium samsonianum TaxID=1882272 RepID=UPI002548C06A|nr:uncharacterized protein N7471_003528 [Penicillium samsonianum]KAJ6144075.1 hypothetical protein N7471_003528 [Penicillium samsonianum]